MRRQVKEIRRRVEDLSPEQLERFNHLRGRAGLPEIGKEDALKLLNALEGESQAQALARIKE